MKHFSFFSDERIGHVVLIPTICILRGRCECCDEPGGWMVSLDWMMWSWGITFDFGGPHP